MSNLELTVTPAIPLKLTTVAPIYITPEAGDPYYNLFTAWVATVFTTGAKRSGYDSGTVPMFSIEDDYLYVLVQSGTGNVGGTGTSIWKKSLMFST